MTLMKSVLLGSAATLVVVAGAQAADLPTKKGAPAAEYVKVCKVGDIAGWLVPGTDTCLKISGFVTARYAAGPTHDVYGIGVTEGGRSYLYKKTDSRQQDAYGTWTRARIYVDAASNTAYGPLIAHAAFQNVFTGGYIDGGAGGRSDVHDSGASVDKAWVTWAGITAGKVESFFDYAELDGAVNSDMDLFAADQSVNALAYTATFGGGFSATISMESPINTAGSDPGYYYNDLHAGTVDGTRAPDFVLSLDVKQGWGDAHLAGLMHQVRLQYGTGASPIASKDEWGWGVNGGVTFKLPSLGAGADAKIVGTYTEGDLGQSGAFSPWNLNLGGVYLNGPSGDAYYNTATHDWNKTKAYTVAGGFDFPIGPTFKISPAISYAHVKVDGTTQNTLLSESWSAWLGGGTLEWVPVHNLAFDLDLLYESGHQDTPNGWDNNGGALSAWKKNFDGFIGELRIERDF